MTRLTYSVAEVAAMTGVPDTTVRGWIDGGEIAATRIGGRVLIHRDELVRVGVIREATVGDRAARLVRDALAEG